jgi:hypothetical protein
MLNPKEGLYQLAHVIPRDQLEEEFSHYKEVAEKGRLICFLFLDSKIRE